MNYKAAHLFELKALSELFRVVITMQLVFLLGSITCPSDAFAQYDYTPYQLSDSFSAENPNYNHDTILYRINRRLDGEDLYTARSYATDAADYAHNLYRYGFMYENWTEWETIVQEYANDIGNSGNYDKMDYYVSVLRDPNINAYATCAGYMFVNVGFLAEIESLEELKLVLGHEIGHNLKDHAYELTINRERAQTAVIIGSLANMWFLSNIFANRAYNSSARKREEEADQIAIELLQSKEYPLQDAAKIYLRFHKMSERSNYSGGGLFGKLYGSTHPAALDRYYQIYEQASSDKWSAPLDEKFMRLRNEARYETLNLLIARGYYNQAILNGWRYLIQDPDNDQIKLQVYNSLIRLKNENGQSNWGEPIISSLVHHKRKMRKKLQRQVIDEDVKAYIEAMLLLINLPEETPFDWFISFSEMEKSLRNDLKSDPPTEFYFIDAFRESEIDKESLSTYVAQDGRYIKTASRLVEKPESNDEKTLFIVSDLSAYTAFPTDYKDYDEVLEKFDFSIIENQLSEDGFNVDFIHLNDSGWFTPRFVDFYMKIEQILYQNLSQNESGTYELSRYYPELAEYVAEMGYNKIVLFEYGEEMGVIKTKTNYFVLDVENSRISSIYMSHKNAPSWNEDTFKRTFKDSYPELKEVMNN